MSDAPNRPVLGTDDHRYAWWEEWGEKPDTEDSHHGWSHHGLVITRSNEAYAFHPAGGALLVLDLDGNLLREIPCDILEAHGMTLVEEDGVEFLWVADPCVKARRDEKGRYKPHVPFGPTGRVRKLTLEGEVVAELATPGHAAYPEKWYFPTWVAVDEMRHGGSGDVWVADGYGASLVHRYDASGTYLATIDGEDGAGRFNCPHAIFVDRRRHEPELYVADRANARIQVYGLDGTYRRVVGVDVLTSPSALASYRDQLVVAELRARVVVLGPDDELVVALGDNEGVCDEPGWPNSLTDPADPARLERSHHLEPGKFNSPHGLAVDADGNLYVAEWLIGGRLTKLEALTS